MKTIVSKLLGMEVVRYAISGVSIAAINFGSFALFDLLGMSYLIANLLAIVLGKASGYFLNKWFVYRSVTTGAKETLFEVVRYILARGFTGVVDYVGVIVLVEGFRMDAVVSKFILQIVVIVLNYVLGKLAVFRSKKS